MKRILLIVLAIVIAVSCFAIPAFADDSVIDGPVVYAPVGPANLSSFTLADRASKADYDGTYLNYYFSMPSFNSRTIFYLNNFSNAIAFLVGSNLSYDSTEYLADGDLLYLRFWPFGSVTGYDLSYNLLDLSGIPSGSRLRIDFPFVFNSPTHSIPSSYAVIQYYDIYGNSVGSQSSNTIFSEELGVYDKEIYSIDLDIPSTGAFAFIYIAGTIPITYRGPIRYTQKTPVVSIGIPENYITEEKLDEINNSIGGVITGIDDLLDKLDKPITPNKPGGAGDLGTDTDAIIDNSQGGLDYAGGLLDSIGGSLAQAATGFAALTAVFNLFSIMPFFSLLLQLSVTIGLFGLMTGLIGSIVSKFSVRGKGD